MDILEQLFAAQDQTYQMFHAKLVPNIPSESIIGVRVPVLKKLAKEFYKDPGKDEFMKQLPHRYYEENQIHIRMILMEKDFDYCVELLNDFLPYADSWAVTDQSSPDCFKKNHDKLKPVLKVWLESDHVYTARFAMNMYMHEFLDEDFSTEYTDMIAAKKGEDYYLKMMIAWYFATALAKQYDAVVPYIKQRKLPEWIHNKAIQKAIESYRITPQQKAYLRTLKVKKQK